MQGSGAAAAQHVIRMDGRQFLKPDSVLVRTALDLLSAHVVDGGAGQSGLCAHCGLHFPCPTVQHARQVVNAGGLLRVSDQPAAHAADGVVERVSDRPVERMPDLPVQRGPESAVEEEDRIASRDRVGAV